MASFISQISWLLRLSEVLSSETPLAVCHWRDMIYYLEYVLVYDEHNLSSKLIVLYTEPSQFHSSVTHYLESDSAHYKFIMCRGLDNEALPCTDVKFKILCLSFRIPFFGLGIRFHSLLIKYYLI